MPIKRHLRTDHQTTEPRSPKVELIGCQAETVVELPFAADSCPWVEKLRTVLLVPLTVGYQRRCGAFGVDASTCAYLHAARETEARRGRAAAASEEGEQGAARGRSMAAATALVVSSVGGAARQVVSSSAAPAYCDQTVANREIRVWHFVIENGY